MSHTVRIFTVSEQESRLRIQAKIEYLQKQVNVPGIIGEDAWWRINELRRQLRDIEA